jgi:hypothetical protein
MPDRPIHTSYLPLATLLLARRAFRSAAAYRIERIYSKWTAQRRSGACQSRGGSARAGRASSRSTSRAPPAGEHTHMWLLRESGGKAAGV